LGIILDQKKRPFGFFEVVVLKGANLGVGGSLLGNVSNYIQDCQDVPFGIWHTSA
jgi:hypothetical protein